MNIVFLGSGEFGLHCLDALSSGRHRLSFVITQPAHGAGRGRHLRPTPVAQWATKNNVPFAEAANINSPEAIRKIRECKPDILVVIAFGQKVGSEVIDIAPNKAINVHASLLPKYRGAAPINWAIVNGETETGISIITLAEKMDTGQILSQVKTSISSEDTAGSLHDRLAEISAPVLLDTIDQIENGTAEYIEQDHAKATLAGKLKKSDGFIDFSQPAEVIERKIRGFWPWPEAAAYYVSAETQKCWRTIFVKAAVVKTDNPKNLAPGLLDENLNVICGTDALKIEKLKPAGSGLMDFADFVNGRNTRPGNLFMRIDW
ncbi:MAG: methionyl-tRNA formyltransferase [Phycisphaerae bacterium]|nr:methionyl-tRNA formyltransferase [Phycisphaerae bacterium]